MKKQNPYGALESKDCKLRNAAMVFLYYDMEEPLENFVKPTGLKLSTIKTYVKSTYITLIYWAREIFEKVQKKAEKIATLISHKMPESAKKLWYTKGHYAYVVKLHMTDGETWTKVGKVDREPYKRLEDYDHYRWSKPYPCKSYNYEVIKLIPCRNAECSEAMENLLRAAMLDIAMGHFAPLDRFTNWDDSYPEQLQNHPLVKWGLQRCAIN